MTTRCALLLLLVLAGCEGTIVPGGNSPDDDPADDDGSGDEEGQDVPLVPDPATSSGVTVDGDGDLVLDPDEVSVLLAHIWVANSPEGTVSKIDTVTGVEVARYRTGPGNPDPSRTTVGLDGDVVVANRGGASAIRIHAETERCPDVNGDGMVRTSTGPTDVLPWGQDECVLWFHAFPTGALARAAAHDFVLDPDGVAHASVWIGLYNAQKLVRLDVETGAVLSEVDIAGHCPYGLAFDGSDQVLWGFSACSGSLIRLDVDTLTWSTVALPSGCAYGITVDPEGRVWTSGGSCVARYTPATQAWNTVTIGTSNRGIAHDGQGSIWVADTSFGVHRLAATTMATQASIPLGGGGFVGMAVDFYHRIWAISQAGSRAHRIDPSTLASVSFPTGSNPYTYSDMTGFQLQNAAPPMGTFVAVLEGCGEQAEWRRLVWTASTPSGTYVRFRARTAPDRASLAAAPLVAIAKQPSDTSPAELGATLEAAAPGSSRARFLELELVLYSIDAAITPEVSHVRVTTSCPPVLGKPTPTRAVDQWRK